ncbi:MAG: LapA family protein [Rhodospirillaceae bacterium]
MRYIVWLLKLALFVIVLTFAVKNTAPVTVHYYLGTEWEAPLILVLLAFFALGAALGLAAGLAQQFRQRRQIALLKRELQARREPPPAVPLDAA